MQPNQFVFFWLLILGFSSGYYYVTQHTATL